MHRHGLLCAVADAGGVAGAAGSVVVAAVVAAAAALAAASVVVVWREIRKNYRLVNPWYSRASRLPWPGFCPPL